LSSFHCCRAPTLSVTQVAMELVKHALANHARGLVGKVLSINSELTSTWLGKGMLSLLTSRACLVCYVVQMAVTRGQACTLMAILCLQWCSREPPVEPEVLRKGVAPAAVWL
jgi:hypothetical protein